MPRPLKLNTLSKGSKIHNLTTNQKFEVVHVDSLAIRMKNIESNELITTLANSINLNEWCTMANEMNSQ